MTGSGRALTADTLGAWLLKTSPTVSAGSELLRPGETTVAERCVRRSYRTALVAAGQPVLLWVSGRSAATPPGIHAQGRTTGPVAESGAGLVVPLALEPLELPVLRSELLAHPTMCRIEVLRMAAGSNPSYLTRTELEQLRSQWPQVTVG